MVSLSILVALKRFGPRFGFKFHWRGYGTIECIQHKLFDRFMD